MVTPVSQFVATQATMNVVSGERWRDVSDEMVRYFLGHYFQPAAPVDAQVEDRVLSLPRAQELRDLRPLSLEGARERFGAGISEEELLLRLTMPAEQVDAMVAARGETAPPLARPGRDPLVRLLGELAKRESLSYVRVEKGDDLVVWRRAA
jgi:oxaloacetate decarboxylase (Na+ extruding) subunit alpha